MQLSVKSMLMYVTFSAVLVAAIVNPNWYWSTIVTVGASLIFAYQIAVVIGSSGRKRQRAICFVTLFALYVYAVANAKDSQFANVNRTVIESVASVIGTTQPGTTDSGIQGYLNAGDGQYYLLNVNNNSVVVSSKEELVGLGAWRYTYSDRTKPSQYHFSKVCVCVFALLIAALGSLVTGYIYDDRKTTG